MKTNGIVNRTLFIHCHLSFGALSIVYEHTYFQGAIQNAGIGKQTDTSWGHPVPPQPSKHWIIWFFFCTVTLWFPLKKKKSYCSIKPHNSLSYFLYCWNIVALARWKWAHFLACQPSARISTSPHRNWPITAVQDMKFSSIMLLPLVIPHCISFLSGASFSLVNLFPFPRSFPPRCSSHVCKTQSSPSLHTACVAFDPAAIPLLSQSDI